VEVSIGLRALVSVLALVGVIASGVSAQEPDLVVRGGHRFDTGRGDFVPNGGLVIKAGKFLEVGADLSGRDLSGVRAIDLSDDDYILPGLFDLHAHHAIDLFGQGRVDEREAYPVLFLANGVTTVFPGGEMNPNEMRELRLRIERGEQPGPRMFNSGPYFGSWRPGWDPDITTAEIYAEVDYWAITPAHLKALIDRAHQHGATVTGHLDSGFRGSVNPRDAILMGIDRVEHFLGGDAIAAGRPAYASLEALDPSTPEFDPIVDTYIRHHVYFDATLTAYGYYAGRDPEVFTYFADEKSYFTPYFREYFDSQPPRRVSEQFERIYWVKRKTIKAFYDAGGGHLITLGTDHPSWSEYISGFAAHRELHAFVLAGIPPADAITIATINGANALGVGSQFGTIEAGKFADLFVVKGNPLNDITNTRNVWLVMKGGVTHDADALKQSVVGVIGPESAEEEAYWKPRMTRP
jgi:imidazolonepropionase-like amidohydrolase